MPSSRPSRRGVGPDLLEVVPADHVLDHLELGRVVPGVVDQRATVLEDQPLIEREFVRLDEIRGADLRAVQAERVGDPVHGPFHGENALRPAGAAIGRDDHRRGVDGEEFHPVGAGLVRAEQLGGGDDRADDPVRGVGAVVVPERDVEREKPAGVVESDRDVLFLAALVRGGDEVLPAVLGPFDRPAEPHRGHRHHDLLRPRMHDLDSEATADIRCDHLDLRQRQAQLGRDRGPDRGCGLRRGVHPQAAIVGVPPGIDAFALQRHRAGAGDGQVEFQPVRRRLHRGVDIADLLDRCAAMLSGISSCTAFSLPCAAGIPTTAGSSVVFDD